MGKIYWLLLLLPISSLLAQNNNYKKESETGHPMQVIPNLQTLKGGLNFLVMGDWGRHGEEHQLKVAATMGSATVGISSDFYIITGDNFYPKGVASIHDPSWQSSFEKVYNLHPHYVDWYVVLGNHDYKTNPDAQIAYSEISARWKMPSRYYAISKKIADGVDVDFFFIDTSPFQKDYYKEDEYKVNVSKTDTSAQKKWLEAALQKSSAKWKFVIGHHPLYSAGKRKGKTQDMENSFANLFEKYKVDAYFCGHEHQLEFDQPIGYHFLQVISGAGSEATPVTSAPYAKFVAQEFGFAAVSITEKEFLLQFINEEGKILFTSTIQKSE